MFLSPLRPFNPTNPLSPPPTARRGNLVNPRNKRGLKMSFTRFISLNKKIYQKLKILKAFYYFLPFSFDLITKMQSMIATWRRYGQMSAYAATTVFTNQKGANTFYIYSDFSVQFFSPFLNFFNHYTQSIRY